MSLFGGTKPTRYGPTAAESSLIGYADRLSTERAGLSNTADLYTRSLATGRAGERSDALGHANADVMQQFAKNGPVTNQNQGLNNLITRGRGLSRVIGATADQFDSQLLRDRIASTMGSRQRQAKGAQVLGGVAGIQESVRTAVENQRLAADSAKQSTLGAVAGAGLGVWANKSNFFQNRSPFGGTKNVDPTLIDMPANSPDPYVRKA